MVDVTVIKNYVSEVRKVLDGLEELIAKETSFEECLKEVEIDYKLDSITIRAVTNKIVEYECMEINDLEYSDKAINLKSSIKKELMTLIKYGDVYSIKGIHEALKETNGVNAEIKEFIDNSEALLEAIGNERMANFLIDIGFVPTNNEFNKDLFTAFAELYYESAFVRTFGYVNNIEIGHEILKAVIKYGRANMLLYVMDFYPDYITKPKLLFKAAIEARNEEMLEILTERLLK